MLSNEVKKIYNYIPPEWQEEVEEEVISSYEVFSRSQNVPCLDETVVNRMGFYHLAICHYYTNNKEVIDETWLEDSEKWHELNNRYPFESYAEEYVSLREDIKNYLNSHNIFYEESWVYAFLPPEEYTNAVKNSPLQNIW